MMIDFKYKNKIIEYNGNYWHNASKDNIRYSILKKMGYDMLIITSDEYNRNKKPKEIIDKCLKFLTC
jgi:very-short-patch-repair endonuclease